MPAEADDKRSVPLLRVLARLWRRRDGRRWIVHGHDAHGRSASLRVSFDEHGIAVVPSQPGGVVLAPLQAGRLRAAIRDAIESVDTPAAAARHIAESPMRSPVQTRRPPRPQPRQRVVLDSQQSATRPNFQPLDLQSLCRPQDDDGSTRPITFGDAG